MEWLNDILNDKVTMVGLIFLLVCIVLTLGLRLWDEFVWKPESKIASQRAKEQAVKGLLGE